MKKIFIATKLDRKTLESNPKFSKLIDINKSAFIDMQRLLEWEIDDGTFININRINNAINTASKLGEEPLEKREDSADKILKSALLQINNYLMYECQNEFYNSIDHINSIKFLSSIAFSHIKGHYLLNGNKRIAFVFLTSMLKLFGYNLNEISNSWKQIYNEWKIIADLPGSNRKAGIDKIYNLVLNNIIKNKED